MTRGTTEFIIGGAVWCIDAPCGRLRRVIIDPVERTVTYLVVDSGHRQVNSHLVPIALVDTIARRNQLNCTLVEFETTEDAQETRLAPWATKPTGAGLNPLVPVHGVGSGTGGLSMNGVDDVGRPSSGGYGSRYVSYDRLPEGKVDLRRGDPISATDGPIGHVYALVVNSGDHRISHVLVEEGSFWGPREVAIPIDAVTDLHSAVVLNLTKEAVRNLPLLEVDPYA